MNSITKFDVFEFLEMEIKQVVSALDTVLASYAQMDNDQRSDSVKRIFDAVERCLATDATLFLKRLRREVYRQAMSLRSIRPTIGSRI